MSSESLLDQMCIQKHQRAINNVPPLRLQKFSPYRIYEVNVNNVQIGTSTGLTKRQLDMRRKIEILKYQNKNGHQTQRNQFTSLINLPSSSARRIPTVECYNNPSKNKNSSADVPGRNMIFEYDPSVPLYNFIPRTESLAFEPTTTDVFYRFHRTQGVIRMPFEYSVTNSEGFAVHNMKSPVTIGLLELYENIPSPEITFRLTATFTLTLDAPLNQLPPSLPDANLVINIRHDDQTHVQIFYSNTELINSKQLSTPGSSNTQQMTASRNTTLNPSIVLNTDINHLPSRTGYIYTLQYNFRNWTISKPNLSPGDSFFLQVSNINIEPVYI
jgi:hypothetical protein